MSKYITVKDAATLWNLSERRVTTMCRNGSIEGATKQGIRWLIPVDAKKPADKRIKSGLYIKEKETLPLPIGISDFCVASTEYYYIDKTMLIKDFLDEKAGVSLFTRPRRFGKTLNMDMLKTFFEKTEKDTSIYFKDKKIWQYGDKYTQYQGKYPVIYVSFKDVKFSSWEETTDNIADIFKKEYDRHKYLLDSSACSEYEKIYFKKILNKSATLPELTGALRELSQMLDEHCEIAPIIIIDEYDTPIQQGHLCGYYDEVVLFMRNLFSGGLKDNKHLSYGFLTGILRVAKESIFSGLNNLKINSVLDDRYSKYFGFTPDEVKQMAMYYNAEDKYDEICKWYDGYRFGENEIFNPWSVINYFNNQCKPRAFWQSTGSNDIIGEILTDATQDIYEHLNKLLQGKSFLTYVDTSVIYPQIKNDPSSVYSFLLVAGYLKVVNSDYSMSGDYMCEVALPNKEIEFVYRKEILSKLNHIIPQSVSIAIQEALFNNDVTKLQSSIGKLLVQSVSYYDVSKEIFYHGLMLGLCAMMDNQYYITSNGESGLGRYDIQLMPKEKKIPGILIELKAESKCTADELKELAKTALAQIHEQKYDTQMKSHGVETIFKYGVAFKGKDVEIISDPIKN